MNTKQTTSSSPLPGHRGRVQPTVQDKEALNWPFYLVLLSLLVEFGRPQDFIPGLNLIPFASIFDGLIGLAILVSGRFELSVFQTRLWLALLALMMINIPIAVNNFWALMVAKDMFQTFCLYLGLVTFVDTSAKMRKLINAWLGVHVFLSTMGLISGGAGIGGWMGDENDFCMVVNMIVPFAFFMMQVTHEPRKKFLYLSLLCLFVLTAMTTLSRGGFFGLAAVGVYCWLKSSRKFNALVVVGLVVIFTVLLGPENYWDEMRSSTDDETMTTGTGAERLYTWGIAWDMFLGNPIFGVGQGNFPWNFEEYQAEQRFNERSLAGRAAHSMYFTLLAELGMFGVFIFAAILIRTMRDLRMIEEKSDRTRNSVSENVAKEDLLVGLARAMSASLIGFLVSSVFISTLYYPSVWVMIGLSVALNKWATSIKEKDNPLGVSMRLKRSEGLWSSRGHSTAILKRSSLC